MSSKAAYDLQWHSPPNSDELLLFPRNDDEKRFGGLDEIDGAAVRVNTLKVLKSDRGVR
jgi:hypothetical protein